MKRQKGKLFFIGASVVWSVLLCALALQPRSVVSIFLREQYLSSLAHLAGHFVLAFSVAMALHLSEKKGFQALWTFGIAAAVCVFSGVVTEAIQIFVPERQPSWNDFKYDMTGSLLGAAAYYGLFFLRKRALGTPSEMLGWALLAVQNLLFPRRPSQAALILSLAALFLGLDSIQFLTVYCLASCF